MKTLIRRGVVVANAVCPSCDGPLVCKPPEPYYARDRQYVVVCANPDCRGTNRVTVEQVFRGPPPNPAA